MLDLVQCVSTIAELLPLVPELTPGSAALPAAHDLALAIGANPTQLQAAQDAFASAQQQLGSVVAQATPIIQAAIGDIVGIGQEFLSAAAKILPRLLSPIPGDAAIATAQLFTLPGIAMAKVHNRLGRLHDELTPAVSELARIAIDEPPALPAEIPPTPASSEMSTPASSAEFIPASSTRNTAGEAAVAAAKSELGTPYVWGGTTPGSGFDCSGLTQWAWRQAGVELPRLAQEQTVGRPVAYEELQAGDLLVWDGHVAMYDGQGSIVEAGDPVSLNPIRTTNMGMTFKGYYRPTG